MSEVKKIATRDSYGNAFSRKNFRSVIGTAELQSVT